MSEIISYKWYYGLPVQRTSNYLKLQLNIKLLQSCKWNITSEKWKITRNRKKLLVTNEKSQLTCEKLPATGKKLQVTNKIYGLQAKNYKW